jgi:two-component system copper resistance phosphate regulon response regulator CusR
VRILLVEDEDRIASFIVKGLSSEGHVVDRAESVRAAGDFGLGSEHDLVVLDLVLPDGDGRTVLKELRSSQADVPVLVLSAQGEVEDKVDLLDMGANDYLTKPFAFRELAARVRALTRQDHIRSDVMTVGDLTLDTRTRVVSRAERRFNLPGKEFALLEYLMRNAGQVMARQQLLDAVWGINFDTESNVVDVYVSYLRRKLDLDGSPSVIETVRGVGYRIPQ